MRTLKALKDLAKKLTGENTIPGTTNADVIKFAADNYSGGGEPYVSPFFFATATVDESTQAITLDKTYTEISEAISAGYIVGVKLGAYAPAFLIEASYMGGMAFDTSDVVFPDSDNAGMMNVTRIVLFSNNTVIRRDKTFTLTEAEEAEEG